ncbi:hypothetical protein DO021_12040 [Desulfobacter hydrogenophilus]|uniref:Uncharacterized protein n=1 Tax=Desulfobacter hydrogenophilus TaxID=2291 RepID=A0A328FB90_9BACT|nr:hypothetical protein DO021_12040 [Desulfobacter hydrogenophilus]
MGNFVLLIDSKLQYEGESYPSRRHRVRNNLPGTRNFSPLIRKTGKLEKFIDKKLSETAATDIMRDSLNRLIRVFQHVSL